MIGTANGHNQLKIITGRRKSVSAMPFASTGIVAQTLPLDPPSYQITVISTFAHIEIPRARTLS
jgi:hypothetical protein